MYTYLWQQQWRKEVTNWRRSGKGQMREIRGRKGEGINRYKTAGQVLEHVSCGNLGKWPTPGRQQRSWHSWVVVCWTVVPSPDVSGYAKHGNPSLGNACLRDSLAPIFASLHFVVTRLRQLCYVCLFFHYYLHLEKRKSSKRGSLMASLCVDACHFQNCNFELILNLKYFFL